MVRFSSRRRKARIVILVLLVFFTIAAGYILRSHFQHDNPPRAPDRHSSKSNKHNDWWLEFFNRLSSTRVTAHGVKFHGKAPAINWKPDTVDSVDRPQLFELSDDDQTKLFESHSSFVHQLPLFASHLPFDANTTGIVTTVGARNFGQAISLVLMTRRTGSHLPIQIILDSRSPWVDMVCSSTMPRFNTTCVFLEELWAGIHQRLPKFTSFQWKTISIIASTFQNVLFLDADCLPMRNPDAIFDLGSEPFTSAGFITYPDFWTSTISPLFSRIAGGLEVPAISSRSSSESGVMVYNKARHADILLLAAYYNYNGPGHYYPMLTQHGAGEGDKETFLQAALVLEALRKQGVYRQPREWMKPGVGVKKGYWDVKTIPSVLGRSEPKGKWRGMFIKQMDPMEDYRAAMAALEKARNSTAETDIRHPTRASQHAGRSDEDDFLIDSNFLATVGNLTLEYDRSRVMFFHHNGVKPDFTRITDPDSGLVATDEKGKHLRMWEDPGWIICDFGRDIEKMLWQDSIEIYCHAEMARFKQLRRVCLRMQAIYGEVYA